jgi:hypothetical protein
MGRESTRRSGGSGREKKVSTKNKHQGQEKQRVGATAKSIAHTAGVDNQASIKLCLPP